MTEISIFGLVTMKMDNAPKMLPFIFVIGGLLITAYAVNKYFQNQPSLEK